MAQKLDLLLFNEITHIHLRELIGVKAAVLIDWVA